MKNSNTKERLNQIMSMRGLKQVDILNLTIPFCKQYDVKFNKSDISQYASGKTEPNQDKLFILGKALDVNEAWLMGYDVPMERVEDVKTVVSKEEKEFLDLFKRLDSADKKNLKNYINNVLLLSDKYTIK